MSNFRRNNQSSSRRPVSRRQRPPYFTLFVLATLLISAALLAATFLLNDDEPQSTPGTLEDDPVATFALFDVGQALSAALVTEDGYALLYDFGVSRANVQDVIVPFFEEHAVESIDLAILSHPHQDHLGGLPELLRTMPIQLYLDPVLETTNQTYAQSLEMIEEREIPVAIARQGDTYSLGAHVDLEILWPTNELITNSDGTHNMNENSVTVRVEIGDVSILLTGDIEREAEDVLVESLPDKLDVDILQAGHHGSNTSSQDHFLTATSPSLAMISAGRDNQYGHPHTEVMQRLRQHEIQIYRTDVDGTVIIQIDGEAWDVTGTRTEQSWSTVELSPPWTVSNWTSSTIGSPFWFSMMLSN